MNFMFFVSQFGTFLLTSQKQLRSCAYCKSLHLKSKRYHFKSSLSHCSVFCCKTIKTHTKSPLSKKKTTKKQNKKQKHTTKMKNYPINKKTAEILCYSSNSKAFLLNQLQVSSLNILLENFVGSSTLSSKSRVQPLRHVFL